MSSSDYILLSSSTGPGFIFGLYVRTGDHSGRPAYKQLQNLPPDQIQDDEESRKYQNNITKTENIRPSIYFCNDGNRYWAVGPWIGASQCYLINFSESRAVPTSGWKNVWPDHWLRTLPGLAVTRI